MSILFVIIISVTIKAQNNIDSLTIRERRYNINVIRVQNEINNIVQYIKKSDYTLEQKVEILRVFDNTIIKSINSRKGINFSSDYTTRMIIRYIDNSSIMIIQQITNE
ncbi:MAG: hypothetical protein LBM02_10170 [Lachnospiraceae bacterium]|jgi:hypothetical protein|nr:hypothetical protein [Lachnospiraceae bacterium]